MRRQKKITKTFYRQKVRPLPLLLALQLALPIQALGQSSESIMGGAQKVANMVGKTANTFIQAQQQRLAQQQAQAQMAQVQQALAIKPVDPTQVPPIFSQNGCIVLQARTERPNSSMSCQRPLNDQLFQQGFYDAIMMTAENNANTFENFLTQGHERFTTQGIGCYEKAQNQLATQLKAREEMLRQMKESIEQRIEAFKKLAENDLNEIKKADILLNGDKSSLSAREREKFNKALQDFRFENQFADNSCKTLMPGSTFGEVGQSMGLRGIEAQLTQNKDDMDAQAFFGKKGQYEADIRKLADEASKNIRERRSFDPSKTESVFAGIQTQAISAKTPALETSVSAVMADINLKQSEQNEKLKQSLGEGNPLMGVSQQAAQGSDIEAALESWERQQKNSCFTRHLNEFGGVEGFIGRIRDPQISDKANREGDSAYKNYISQIISDPNLSIEEKVERASRNQQGLGGRHMIQLGKSSVIRGQVIGGSTRINPADMIKIMAQDCRDGFEQDQSATGFTPRQQIESVREYARAQQALKQEFASSLKTQIIQSMIDCPENTSTGVAANSCMVDQNNSPTSISSPGFCVRTANACASNALACHEKAKKMVEDVRTGQRAVAARYKQNMDQLKQDLIAEFSRVNNQLEQSARIIDGMFQVGTVYETVDKDASGQLALNFTDQELMAGVDPSLVLENPDKYKAKVMDNIDATMHSLQKHSDELMAKMDQEVQKYSSNYQKEQAFWANIAQTCAASIGAFQGELQDIDGKRQEDIQQTNEELIAVCSKYSEFKSNPCPSGSRSDVGSLASDINAIAGKMDGMNGTQARQASQQINNVIAQCDSFGSDSGPARYNRSSSEGAAPIPKGMTVDTFCQNEGRDFVECADFNSVNGDRKVCDHDFLEKYFNDHLTGEKATDEIICLQNFSNRSSYKITKRSECSKDDIEEVVTEYTTIEPEEKITKVLERKSGCVKNLDQSAPRLRAEASKAMREYYLSQNLYGQAGEVRLFACEAGNNAGRDLPNFMDGFNRAPAQQPGVNTLGF